MDEFETVEALLRDRGESIPEEVYGLVGRTTIESDAHGTDRDLRELIDQGPIYEPLWGDYTYIIPGTPKVLFVVGADSTTDAAEALNRLCDMEQIDLSIWYQVQSTSSTSIPSPNDFKKAIRSVRRDNEHNGIGMNANGISYNEDKIMNSLVQSKFYISSERSDTEAMIGVPRKAFPSNDFGDHLWAMLKDGSGSVPGNVREQFMTDVELNQVAASFSTMLDLLSTGTVFGPYSIDLRYNKPSVQPLFNEVAREFPETVLSHTEKIESFLQSKTSTTAPEVSCRLLCTLVESHPDRFDELVPMLRRLWKSKSAHPRRRVLDIVTDALDHGDPDITAALDINPGSQVNYLINCLETTQSAWLKRSCYAAIYSMDLDDTDYEILSSSMATLLEPFQVEWSKLGQRNENQNTVDDGYSLHSPQHSASTDSELLDKIRSPTPSKVALYNLRKSDVEHLTVDIVENHPESILPHLDILIKYFTLTGDQMQFVRYVPKKIVRVAIRNLTDRYYEELSQFDDFVLPLLETTEFHDVQFALAWARRSQSKASVDALAAIHAEPTHNQWQQATAILKDIAPDRVDDNLEPDNARSRWKTYVSEVASEQGKLPASGDLGREDMPEPPHWELFDGWKSVLQSLDIETTYRVSNAPLRGQLIKDIRQVAEKVDGIPRTSDIDEYGEYNYTNLKNEFGGIRQARKAAGINKKTEDVARDVDKSQKSGDMTRDVDESKKTEDSPTREELIEALKHLNNAIQRVPRTSDMNQSGEYSAPTYYDEFSSWNQALAAAGIETGRAARTTAKRDIKEELTSELQRLAETLGRTPKTTDVKESSEFSLGRYYAHYDSWGEAIEDADLQS